LVWTPHDPTLISVTARFQPPSAEHWLGTDQLGRDVASMLMVGARHSVAVALLAVGIGGTIGTALGLAASAVGGWVEEAVMRLADIGFAFPALLFAIMLSAVFGPSLTNAVAAIAFINAPIFARVARGSAALIWRLDYAMAARAAGRSRAAIALSHVLPNISAVLLVQATIEFAVAILAEAALSYLGLGVQPPTPSWGRMLSEAQTLLFLQPMLAIWPGLCIVAAVIGFNMLGDGLRDATDPRLARAR
ncbi:MAG: ABC transporter permease, partial [Pseudomonadota bacterium]|nr:ABC transporter permease [Pseudomonadota bacterium]